MKNMFLLNFAMLLNKPATAHVKIRGHLTVFLPTDGNTCFDGIVSLQEIRGRKVMTVPTYLYNLNHPTYFQNGQMWL